jgi:uncharacterized protein (TIGR02453 family)
MRAAKPKAATQSGFSGFRPAALGFFRDLAANQDRAWFQANRDTYDREVLAPLRALIADLVTEFSRRGVTLTGDPLKAVFRIHRDVRFSRDKRPYKQHAGAVLSRDGSKSTFGMFYIHVDPTGSFAAAGFYQPEPKYLEALRTAMVEERERLHAALAAAFASGAELMRDDALARLPRGFEHAANTDVAEYVRQRHLVVRWPIPAASLAERALVGTLAGYAEAAKPLLAFGWDAL